MTCKHPDFEVQAAITHLSDSGKIVADIRIKCTACGTPMQFKGLPTGFNADGAMVAFDGTELRIGIRPFDLFTPLH